MMRKLCLILLSILGYAKAQTAAYFDIKTVVNPQMCENGSINLTVTGGSTPYYFTWSNGQTSSGIQNLTAGSYTVTIKDLTDRDTVLIIDVAKEKCKIGAEMVFTPNDDGINDTWQVTNLSYYPDYKIYVYNRWGQKVYEHKGTFTFWDGRSIGIELPAATYYYVIYYDKDEKDIEKGTVTIVR